MKDKSRAGFCAPTTPSNSTAPPRENYNYTEIFDRPVFTAKSPVWERTTGRNDRIRLDGRGKPRYFSKNHLKGRSNIEWLEKNTLNDKSEPSIWVDAIMKSDGNRFHEHFISKWTLWTNAKAILSNIGLGGRYNLISFTPVDTKEIKQRIGLLILNGWTFRATNDSGSTGRGEGRIIIWEK